MENGYSGELGHPTQKFAKQQQQQALRLTPYHLNQSTCYEAMPQMQAASISSPLAIPQLPNSKAVPAGQRTFPFFTFTNAPDLA
jgi:hypothetical protein